MLGKNSGDGWFQARLSSPDGAAADGRLIPATRHVGKAQTDLREQRNTARTDMQVMMVFAVVR